MAIRLSDFVRISQNRDYNEGSVYIHDGIFGKSLYRANHHHTFKFLNNTRLQAQQNFRVRDAFCKALESEYSLSPRLKNELRARLGLADGTREVSERPLERREIKQILDLVNARKELMIQFAPRRNGSKPPAEMMLDAVVADPQVVAPDRRGNEVVDGALRGLALTRTYEKLYESQSRADRAPLTETMLRDALRSEYEQVWNEFHERLEKLVPDPNAAGAKRYELLGAFGCKSDIELRNAVRILDELHSQRSNVDWSDKAAALTLVSQRMRELAGMQNVEVGSGQLVLWREIRRCVADISQNNLEVATTFTSVGELESDKLERNTVANWVKSAFAEYGVHLLNPQLRKICVLLADDIKHHHVKIDISDCCAQYNVIKDRVQTIAANLKAIGEAQTSWKMNVLNGLDVEELGKPDLFDAIIAMAKLDFSDLIEKFKENGDVKAFCEGIGDRMKSLLAEKYRELSESDDNKTVFVSALDILAKCLPEFQEVICQFDHQKLINALDLPETVSTVAQRFSIQLDSFQRQELESLPGAIKLVDDLVEALDLQRQSEDGRLGYNDPDVYAASVRARFGRTKEMIRLTVQHELLKLKPEELDQLFKRSEIDKGLLEKFRARFEDEIKPSEKQVETDVKAGGFHWEAFRVRAVNHKCFNSLTFDGDNVTVERRDYYESGDQEIEKFVKSLGTNDPVVIARARALCRVLKSMIKKDEMRAVVTSLLGLNGVSGSFTMLRTCTPLRKNESPETLVPLKTVGEFELNYMKSPTEFVPIDVKVDSSTGVVTLDTEVDDGFTLIGAKRCGLLQQSAVGVSSRIKVRLQVEPAKGEGSIPTVKVLLFEEN